MAGAEFLALWAEIAGLIIGHQTCDLPTHAGDQTDDCADGGSDAERARAAAHFCDGLAQRMGLDAQDFKIVPRAALGKH